MLPESRSGKISTSARPATTLSGALRRATPGSSAASAWSSPSKWRSGRRRRASAHASRTLATLGCSALPRVENERNAVCGTARVSLAKWSAARHAISASCSEVGSGTTPQSANISTRSLAVRPAAAGGDGTTIRKKEVRVRTSGMSPISHSAARSTSAVVRLAPATKQSARPARTLAAAWNRGSRARVSTSGGWRRARHEPPRRPAEARHFLDQGGVQVGVLLARHQKGHLETGRETAVHERHLELELEVAHGAQAADHDLGADPPGTVHDQVRELHHLDTPQGARGGADHLHPLADRKQGSLARAVRHRHHHAVEQPRGPPGEVEVPVRERVEGSGDRPGANAGHGRLSSASDADCSVQR